VTAPQTYLTEASDSPPSPWLGRIVPGLIATAVLRVMLVVIPFPPDNSLALHVADSQEGS
jgi:hypothetical protein